MLKNKDMDQPAHPGCQIRGLCWVATSWAAISNVSSLRLARSWTDMIRNPQHTDLIGFLIARLNIIINRMSLHLLSASNMAWKLFEPCYKKTSLLVFDQARHRPTCLATSLEARSLKFWIYKQENVKLSWKLINNESIYLTPDLHPCSQMSLVIRKPAFCIILCENKDADQLRGNREADQRLCFRYTDSTIPLLPKSQVSSL